MKKKEKQTALNELINFSGINDSLEKLNRQFCVYQKSIQTKNNRYTIEQELADFRKRISAFQNRLKDLIEYSSIWED